MDDLFVFLTLPIAIPMHFLIRAELGDRIGRKLPYHPRLLNWMWAAWGGLFWLPCPICHRNFGGHEWSESLMTSAFQGEGVCPKCAKKAREKNEERREEFDQQMSEHYSQFFTNTHYPVSPERRKQ